MMTSPAVGRIMAAMVLHGYTNDPIASALHPRRFAAGEMIIEPLLNRSEAMRLVAEAVAGLARASQDIAAK